MHVQALCSWAFAKYYSGFQPLFFLYDAFGNPINRLRCPHPRPLNHRHVQNNICDARRTQKQRHTQYAHLPCSLGGHLTLPSNKNMRRLQSYISVWELWAHCYSQRSALLQRNITSRSYIQLWHSWEHQENTSCELYEHMISVETCVLGIMRMKFC